MSESLDIRTEGPLVYARPRGKVLRLNLYRPASDDGRPHPAVVLIHGGAWFGGMRQQLRWYGRHFAEAGYVAIAIDYRRMFRWAFPHCLHDVKAAVRWLRLHAGEYHVDSDRIAALGNSAGGHLATMLAATRPEHGFEGDQNPGPSSAVQAAICLYGPQDLKYYVEPEGVLRAVAPISAWYINHFAERDHQDVANPLEAASPLTYVDADTAPVFIVHGTRDWLAPHAHSVRLYNRLQDLGVPSEFVSVEGRNHAFDFIFWEERERLFGQMQNFLQRVMGKEAPPAARVANGHD